MSRRFVDTPEASGNGSATSSRIARLRRQNVKLKFLVSLTSSLALLLALALAVALWSPTAQAAQTDVHPARPGYSKVLGADDPVNVAQQTEKDRQVVLKPAPVEIEKHRQNVFVLFAATVAWIIFLVM